MLMPLQITFRRTARVDWLEADIHARAAALERYCPTITACRVIVEPAQRHHHDGNPYHVRVDLTVPGEEIVVSRDASLHATAKDIGLQVPTKGTEVRSSRRHAKVAVREAFDSARRQLQDYRRRLARVVKTHEPLPRGRIVKLLPDRQGGFIAAEDGREIYFHRNSVLNRGFNRLDIGQQVTFVDAMGDRGPQASTVRAVARRGAPQCGITPLADSAPAHRLAHARRRRT